MKRLLITSLLLAPSLARAEAVVTKVMQPSVPQFALQAGSMAVSGQVEASALLGHPVLAQRPLDKILEIQTDRGPVFVKMSAVLTTGTLPMPARGCVQIGPQSADRTGHSVNGISRDCANER